MKTLIVSNRLPVKISKEKENLEFSSSIGGLATGLRSIHDREGSLWVGWLGISMDELTSYEVGGVTSRLANDFRCVPVFLDEEDIDLYYTCFCNKTIWPLFHYFPTLTEYKTNWWQRYREVNLKFFKTLMPLLRDGDTVWIHDYHLMLLPEMIRNSSVDVKIGFFLHIPFPSFEMFRLLPWRNEILNGLLGADLIGFHTYDYARHFQSSARRLKRLDATLGTIKIDERTVNVDAFPMGIDYDKYVHALEENDVTDNMLKFREKVKETKVVLSVDRLDYTKGIPHRLKAFDQFLERFKEWRERVTLILIAAPSRTDVDTYLHLKKEVDELVSKINSRHGTIGWIPVWYYYRSFEFKKLTAMYGLADVLLVTPLCDGMNLIAKEYISTKADKRGCTVISETAGAASELGEALIVNPNNVDEIADSINRALTLPEDEQVERNSVMHKRLERYNVNHWAEDFIDKLERVVSDRNKSRTAFLSDELKEKLLLDFGTKNKRYIFLDYDGTLVPFKEKPEQAKPDARLMELLARLSTLPDTELIIVSGRDRDILEEWLGELDVHLVAGHGVCIRRLRSGWECIATMSNDWKKVIRPVLEIHADRTPGSFIEEKRFSLAWHYRRCDFDLAALRISELKDALLGLTDNLNIGILEGNKVLEIKDTSINKGRAVSYFLPEDDTHPFILAAGDDWTDEDMFAALKKEAWTIKIGVGQTNARYKLENLNKLRELLHAL